LLWHTNESNCARTLNIQEVSTGKVVYQEESNNLFPEYLPNAKAFINVGHCEGGSALLVDLNTGQAQTASGYAIRSGVIRQKA